MIGLIGKHSGMSWNSMVCGKAANGRNEAFYREAQVDI